MCGACVCECERERACGLLCAQSGELGFWAERRVYANVCACVLCAMCAMMGALGGPRQSAASSPITHVNAIHNSHIHTHTRTHIDDAIMMVEHATYHSAVPALMCAGAHCI